MPEENLTHLRAMLLQRRQEVFNRVRQLESDWQSLTERDIELEEEAQKSDLTLLFDQLDERGREQIEAIDLALCRMASGSYGICEDCEQLIQRKRLEALPETRLCLACARRYEAKQKKLRRPREALPCSALPDEYRNLDDEEMRMAIVEQLFNDKRVDLEELEISCLKGVVYLKGSLPGKKEHHILLQILTDVMGLTSIVDLLQSDEVVWEREERAPGKNIAVLSEEEQLAYGVEDYTDDVFEAGEEGVPYVPPEGPISKDY